MIAFEKKLCELAKLSRGWDSYDALPVFPAVIDRVREVLERHPASGPRARIVPTSEGGIQLEWSNGNKEVEIEFHPDGSTTFLQCGQIERPGQEVTLMQWVSVIG
jgi:hypothetical protein